MRSARRLLLLSSLLVLCIFIGLSRCKAIGSAKLLVPTWFGFTEISEDVYVDKEMTQTQRDGFIETLRLAKDRVSAFFGDLEGSPKVFACSTEECFVSHGGVSAKGHALGNILLLSPRGLDVVITSHELTHIELHNRIGRLIPSWFDEGLAVLVSEDPRYTEEAWLRATDKGLKAPKLKDIRRLLGKGDWLLSYGTARREVGAWYLRGGNVGLEQLITEVKSGRDFDSAYGNEEKPFSSQSPTE